MPFVDGRTARPGMGVKTLERKNAGPKKEK